MIDEGETAHEILGLTRSASGAEVREAYIRLAKQYHPDKHPDDLAAERRFKRITQAYNELRSSYHGIRGAQFYRGPEFWNPYRRVLAIAVLFFVLTPLATFLVMRSGQQSVLSLEPRQAEGAASSGTREASGTAPVKEATIESRPARPAPPERTAAEMDRLMPGSPRLQENSGSAEAPPISHERSSDVSADGISVASLRERFDTDARFPGSASPEAHRSSEGADKARRPPEATPPAQARTPGLQAPSSRDEIAVAPAYDTVQPKDQDDQKKVASLQQGMQDKREPAVEPQAPPNRNKAAAERTGKKSIVPSKTINTAAISIPGNKQWLRPERPVISARAAPLVRSLDRTVLTAAPGG